MNKLLLASMITFNFAIANAQVYQCQIDESSGVLVGATIANVYINEELSVEVTLPGAKKSSVGLSKAEVAKADDDQIVVKRYGPDGERREFILNKDGTGSLKLYDDTFFGLFGELYGSAKFINCVESK